MRQRRRTVLLASLLVLAATLAAGAGLAAGLALQGPGRFLSSPLGQWLDSHVPALTASLRPPLPGGLVVVRIGEPVPVLTLDGLHGEQPQPVHTAGRRQLVNFWASWCGPCREELPLLQRFAEEQGVSGVQVVFVALEESTDARVLLPTVADGALSLQQLPGPADASVVLGNTGGFLPYSVLISEDGRLLRRKVGPFPDADAVRAFVTN